MKTKLTVTVDRDLLPRAKRFARERGVSLSSLIEDSLRDLTDSAAPSFVDRWRGGFVLADRNDERYRSLLDKYR
jgi:post-segregation antitoxin (ccd killing protein)